MNDAIATADVGAPAIGADGDIALDGQSRLALYFAVGLGAGAVIALQIDIMRVFSVGSWAHFGSLVVSLAMLGFGLTSAVMCVAKDWFAPQLARRGERRARAVRTARGRAPISIIQQLGFNAIFLVSDPAQKWKLLEIFLAALTPFLAGAVFLGCVFLKSNRTFGRVYFADLAGSGLCGLIVLLRDVWLHAGQPHRGAARAVARGVPRLELRPRGKARDPALSRRSPSSPSAAISSPRRPWA